MNPVKERDKSYKRKSYLNRSRHTEAVLAERSSESKEFTFDMETATVASNVGRVLTETFERYPCASVQHLSGTMQFSGESGERRSRRQSVRRGQVSEVAPSPVENSCGNRQVASPRRKHNDLKVAQCGAAKKTCSSSAVISAASSKRSIAHHQPRYQRVRIHACS